MTSENQSSVCRASSGEAIFTIVDLLCESKKKLGPFFFLLDGIGVLHASNASVPFSLPIPLFFIPPLRQKTSSLSLITERGEDRYTPGRAWVIAMVGIDPTETCLYLRSHPMGSG